MKKFVAGQLSDKQNPDIEKIFSIGFQYLLSSVADKYSQTQRYKSIQEFNQKNFLSKSLISSYPFFIALSNGHGISLYNLFGPFYTYSFGPVSESVLGLIEKNSAASAKDKLAFFQIDKGLKVNSSTANNFQDLKTGIINSSIQLSDGGYSFKEITIRSDAGENLKSNEDSYYTPLFAAIDNGINILSIKTNSLFFDGTLKRIIDSSVHFTSLARRYSNNSAELIEYGQIEHPTRRAIYTDKPLIN